MEIRIRKEDSLRLTSGGSIDDVFADSSFIANSSDSNYNEGLAVSFYGMHQIFIVEKERVIRVFSFRESDKVTNGDFGWWSDGQLIFTNSEVYRGEPINQ